MSCDFNSCYHYRAGTAHTHYGEDAMNDPNPPMVTCSYCAKEGKEFSVRFDSIGADSMKGHLAVVHGLVGSIAITPDA